MIAITRISKYFRYYKKVFLKEIKNFCYYITKNVQF